MSMAQWSKIYRAQVYEKPPLTVPHARSRELTAKECRRLTTQMAGKPVLEEHGLKGISYPVGRVVKFEQDPATGSLWGSFQLRTDLPTYQKVMNKEMLGVSLGHDVLFTLPERTIVGQELSVCMQGERPNTLIVNASSEPGFYPLPPMATSYPVIDLNNCEFVSEEQLAREQQNQQQRTGTGLYDMPIKVIIDGKTHVTRPRKVQASQGIPQQPPQQQQLPFPFHDQQPQQQQPQYAPAPMYPPPPAPVAAAPVAAAPAPVPPSAPAPERKEGKEIESNFNRKKAKKRSAESEAADAAEAKGEDDMESDDSEDAKAPATKKPHKKPAANEAATSEPALENEEDMAKFRDDLMKSNLPTPTKTAMLTAMLDNYESRKKEEQAARAECKDLIDKVEATLRSKGQSDEEVGKWKADLGNVMEKPLKNPAMITMLRKMAMLSGSGGQSHQQPSSSSSSSSSSSTYDSDLQRQLNRMNAWMPQNQPTQNIGGMEVRSSRATAPPSFPVYGSYEMPCINADGTRSIFRAPDVNVANLQSNPNIKVKANPYGEGWSVNGRPMALNPPTPSSSHYTWDYQPPSQ